MAMVLPGVTLTNSVLTTQASDTAVTTPLFIGFTQQENDRTLQTVKIESLSEATSHFGEQGDLYQALRHFFDNKGSYCYVLSLGKLPETQTGAADAPDNDNPAAQSLLTALQEPALAEIIATENRASLLAVPEMSGFNLSAETADGGLSLWQQGWTLLLSFCQRRRDLFALLEAPESTAVTNKLVTAISASNLHQAAAWWPRLQTQYVDDTGSFRVLSPVAAVAAVIQNNARQYGIWNAPANIALAKVVRPTLTGHAFQPLLNEQGINLNLIRSFAGKGVRLWGCRTLMTDTASPWRYIQTRLLANYVESQLSRLVRLWLFEPNNALTWMKIKGQTLMWLQQQWRAGAFYGTKEEDAYNVSIGLNETMTETDISQGLMRMNIRLALLAPAEFIDISLVLDSRNGISVQTQQEKQHVRTYHALRSTPL